MRKYLLKFLPYFGVAFFFSLFINLLQLSYVLYVRLLFDKVMVSGSVPSLVYLSLGAIAAFAVMGLLELLRSKLLVRVGVSLDRDLGSGVFERMLAHAARAGAAVNAQALKDVNAIRSFFGGVGIFSLFDAPWVPIYLGLIFLFHSWLGTVAVGGGLLLLVLVLAQEISTAGTARRQSEAGICTQQFLNSTMRNAQAVHAMGMLPALTGRWRSLSSRETAMESELAGKEGLFQSSAKLIMMSASLVIMAIGGYLVINHRITIGTMIASSMIMGKALSPIMMLGSAWKQFVQSRIAYTRLSELFPPDSPPPASLPDPGSEPGPFSLQVEEVELAIAGQPVLRGVSFGQAAGEALAIVGPSGAGKSTLARVLLGIWPPDGGRILRDGRHPGALDEAEQGSRTGYVPQDVELFPGTVAENIARMGQVDDEEVVRAAEAADAHEMILGLPAGYDTLVGRGGINLSGGQKQRVALARAFYGSPPFIVLDEPDSHLDTTGREALARVLRAQKEQGVALILITHNPALLKVCDRTLELREGRVGVRVPTT